MFFIAYFIDAKVHVIVPKTWVFEIDKHWEKFVNRSINRNQKFLCFYSEESDATIYREGLGYEPNGNFIADFSLPKIKDFPRKGLYEANLFHFKCKYRLNQF